MESSILQVSCKVSEARRANFYLPFYTEDTRSFPDLGARHYPEPPHKATGPDDISPRFLKEMAEPLTQL